MLLLKDHRFDLFSYWNVKMPIETFCPPTIQYLHGPKILYPTVITIAT